MTTAQGRRKSIVSPLLTLSLKGRVVAVDIADDSGGAFRHRFWAALTALCRPTPHGWSLSGDVNSTVFASERATPENRQHFLSFLEDCNTM